MAVFQYRDLRLTPEAEYLYTEWLASLDASFTRDTTYEARSEIVRDTLRIILPQSASTIVRAALDPRNITLEPEYYGDVNIEQYNLRKPLIWFWQMFDRSPLGLNHWLGFRFRCMLGRHIFRHLGTGVKIFHNVEFTYGYNLTIEDNCTIHKNVMLDDRGEIILHEGTSVSDYANIYSHTHDINHQADVTNKVTELGPRARVTYHATVLAGASVGENAMLGAMGLATKPVPPATVAVGIPAHVKLRKQSQPTSSK
jgi:acetyltransferase-like isoleucine patch superfamily enzyme